MKRLHFGNIVLRAFIVISMTGVLSAQAGKLAVQGIVGATQIDEDEITFSDIDELEGLLGDGAELPTLFTMGAAGQQTIWGGEGATLAGLDYGGLFSFGGDDRDVRAHNGTAIINVDSSLMLLDLFFGLFVSQDIGGRVNLYGACGPLVMVGRITGDFVEREIEEETDWELDESETAIGVGGYVRAGIEIHGKGSGSFGLGVRGFTSTLDFDDTLGEVEFQGVQGFITYTKRM